MNRNLIILGTVFAAGTAFVAGRMLVDPTDISAVVSNANLQKPPKLGDPNLAAQSARERLSKLPPTLWATSPVSDPAPADGLALAGDLQPPPITTAIAAPPAPPPPKSDPGPSPEEVAGQLSRTIAAVKRSNGIATLVVIDPAAGTRRVMKVGDLYRDGWRIVHIDTRSVTLARKSAKIAAAIGYGARAASSAVPYVPLPVIAAATTGSRPAVSDPLRTSSSPRRRVTRPGSPAK